MYMLELLCQPTHSQQNRDVGREAFGSLSPCLSSPFSVPKWAVPPADSDTPVPSLPALCPVPPRRLGQGWLIMNQLRLQNEWLLGLHAPDLRYLLASWVSLRSWKSGTQGKTT